MDAERVLLLIVVVLASASGAGTVLWRRERTLRSHALLLAALGAAAVSGLLRHDLGRTLAWPLFLAWAAAVPLPMALSASARRFAARRRYDAASRTAALAAGLLLLPDPLRREARFYAALAAADRGDGDACRARLGELAELETPTPGAASLREVLPLVAERRSADVLRAIDGAPERTPILVALEANAACETGDLRRALRAERELSLLVRDAAPAVAQVRRAVLAAAGRAVFLEEAIRTGLPVADGPPGAALLALARALEASGETERAADVYRESEALARGSQRRDAAEGAARCARGEPRRAAADELEESAVHDLERACRATVPDPSRRPIVARAPATLAICAVTLLAGALFLTLVGADLVAFVAAGALSAPLVRDDGEWWRLASAMLVHAGPGHLILNVASIAVVGVPYEERAGSVRTVIVYVVSGLLASAASVYGNDTDAGVGASGAAMGLFGALAALLVLRGHLFEREHRRTWLAACGAMLLANAALGAAAHRVIDNAAHGGGLAAGALVAWLLLPAPLDGEFHRAARRMAAAGLLAFVAVCEGAVLRDLRDWRRSDVQGWRGATARVPSWLVFADKGALGAVAWRRPLPLVLQMGREGEAWPDAPELLRLGILPARDDGSGAAGGAPDTRWTSGATSVRTEGGLRIEESVWRPDTPPARDWTDALLGTEDAAAHLTVLRRGGAFAAVVTPADAEVRAAFDPVVAEIARTLAPSSEGPPR